MIRVQVAGREFSAPVEYLVHSVPRVGELIRTNETAAARVTDVRHNLVSGVITLEVQ